MLWDGLEWVVDGGVWRAYNVCMKSMTINISMPSGLYKAAKMQAQKQHYTSVSELIRDALRWFLDDRLTRNGFTPEFEEEVLRRSKESTKNDIVWDGNGSFVDFVLNEGAKKYGESSSRRQLQAGSKRVVGSKTRVRADSGTAGAVV